MPKQDLILFSFCKTVDRNRESQVEKVFIQLKKEPYPKNTHFLGDVDRYSFTTGDVFVVSLMIPSGRNNTNMS